MDNKKAPETENNNKKQLSIEEQNEIMVTALNSMYDTYMMFDHPHPDEFGVLAQKTLLRIGRLESSIEYINMDPERTLEALIPAIMEIEGGYYENVCDFIARANEGLQQSSSPYSFDSTSKVQNVGTLGEGEYVDRITVIGKQ